MGTKKTEKKNTTKDETVDRCFAATRSGKRCKQTRGVLDLRLRSLEGEDLLVGLCGQHRAKLLGTKTKAPEKVVLFDGKELLEYVAVPGGFAADSPTRTKEEKDAALADLERSFAGVDVETDEELDEVVEAELERSKDELVAEAAKRAAAEPLDYPAPGVGGASTASRLAKENAGASSSVRRGSRIPSCEAARGNGRPCGRLGGLKRLLDPEDAKVADLCPVHLGRLTGNAYGRKGIGVRLVDGRRLVPKDKGFEVLGPKASS